jgi:signal transduction histidine kinase
MLVSSQGDLQEIRIERIDLPQLALDSLDKVRFMPGASGMDMHVDTDETYPFYSDKMRLVSILDNLIANAIKYSDPAKEVSRLHIYVNVRKANAELKVRDNGIGIQKKCLDKVFDRFFRATSSTEGTGLGLSFVKESVDKLNGSIDIKSRVGYGTMICLQLPNYGADHPTGVSI